MSKTESRILYKKTKKGAIQQWQVVADGDSFYTIEGLVGGKLTTSTPYICKPKNTGKKNETTAEQQALKEAQSAFQKKLDRSYSLDINTCDVKKYFEPMLAESYEDYKHKIIYPVFSQPKLDGIRCITNKDGMWSRYGKPFVSAPHIFQALKPYFDLYPKLVYDGELYCDKYKSDFNKIASYVRTSKTLTQPKLKEIAENLQYWIYDFPSDNNFYDRYFDLIELMAHKCPSCIVLVTTREVRNQQELDDVYDLYRADGVEGQIIRFNTPYENYRTQNLLKRKEFFDKEYQILEVIDGEGNRTGTAGKFVCLNEDGKQFGDGTNTFECNIKGNFEYLREILRNKKAYIGKMATVRYPNLTPAGKPRFGYAVAIRDYE